VQLEAHCWNHLSRCGRLLRPDTESVRRRGTAAV
jgi:hypothetical protein